MITSVTGKVLTHASPSQITTFRKCQRKWHWEKVEGFRAPDTPSTILGTKVHSCCEKYLATGSVPPSDEVGRIALPGLLHLPDPGTEGMRIEQALLISGPNTAHEKAKIRVEKPSGGELELVLDEGAKAQAPAKTMTLGGREVRLDQLFQATHPGLEMDLVGFIDLWMPWKRYCLDHKTTSNFKYAKTPEELQKDAQAIIYGWLTLYFARQKADEGSVLFKHVYYRTRGSPASKTSEVTFSPNELDTLFEQEIVATVKAMRVAATLPIREVPPNSDECSMYGGCPHYGRCASIGFIGDVKRGNSQTKSPSAVSLGKAQGSAESVKGVPTGAATPAQERERKVEMEALDFRARLLAQKKAPAATAPAQAPVAAPASIPAPAQVPSAKAPTPQALPVVQVVHKAAVDIAALKASIVQAEADAQSALSKGDTLAAMQALQVAKEAKDTLASLSAAATHNTQSAPAPAPAPVQAPAPAPVQAPAPAPVAAEPVQTPTPAEPAHAQMTLPLDDQILEPAEQTPAEAVLVSDLVKFRPVAAQFVHEKVADGMTWQQALDALRQKDELEVLAEGLQADRTSAAPQIVRLTPGINPPDGTPMDVVGELEERHTRKEKPTLADGRGIHTLKKPELVEAHKALTLALNVQTRQEYWLVASPACRAWIDPEYNYTGKAPSVDVLRKEVTILAGHAAGGDLAVLADEVYAQSDGESSGLSESDKAQDRVSPSDSDTQTATGTNRQRSGVVLASVAWEYLLWTATTVGVDELNSLGAQGWEALQVQMVHTTAGVWLSGLFKRQVGATHCHSTSQATQA